MKKFFILAFLFLSFFAKASHISGGQITYKCLGNNLYEVKLTYFWDCQGGFNPGTSQLIDVSGCGNALSLTVNQSSLTPGDGVAADGLCANSGLTTCKKRIEYIGTVTLPSTCNSWTFSIGSCCRGGNITNISGGTSASYYHFATLNNVAAPCNNSADISIGTLPSFCVNQAACFNLGATEQDGNTLSYAFIDAYQTATTFVTYNGGYSGAVPITGITIDPATGQINFTPTTIGDFVITVQITEKDANGNIVGTIMRDFQVIVSNCNNQTVTCGQGAISNVTSGNVPGGNGNTLQICENIPFCFDVNFVDPDLGDSVKISSPNISTTLPGSSMVMTYTPGIKNKVSAHICWTPPQGSSGLNTNFVLIVKDNACPVPGTQVLNYFIDVLPATSAGPDRTICGTQAASITATGSSTVFTWSDLAGTAIPVGPAFSCNPCSNPVIKPAVTSTYVVTNVGGGQNCKNKDTLVINVVPDFTLSANVINTSGCLNSVVQFTSSINPAGAGYTYTWSPSAPLTSTNTANTSAIYSSAGTYNYTLSATNAQGCKKQSSSIVFTANPVVMPQFTVVPTNTTLCSGGSIPLSVNFGSAPPSTCGLATTGCVSPSVKIVGTGTSTNGNTGSPTPYSNYWKSSHIQMLFLASELNAAGIVAGKISSLAFNISTLNSLSYALPNYTIKMKCTSANSLSAFDNAGLSQVYYASSYMPTTGVNTHNFTQAYEWDGVSNILVNVCYDRIAASSYVSSGATSAFYTTTGFTSVIYDNADAIDMCAGTNFSSTSSNRPNVRFGNCLSTPPNSSFSFNWTPSTGLSSTSVPNPTANITSSVQYTVTVTPLSAPSCSNVGTSSLTIVSPATPSITTSGSTICSNVPSFSLTGLPVGGTWSVTAPTSVSGIFTPSLAAIGNNTITYTYGGVGCSQTTTAVIPVEQFIPSTITGTINPICLPAAPINLSTALPTSTVGPGVWSGPGVTGTTFDPTIAGTGIQVLTYNTNSGSMFCSSTSSIAVLINSASQPTMPSVNPMCTNGPTLALLGNPTGGIWQGSGISAVGVLTPSLATTGTNTYTYTVGSSTCSAANTTTISIVQYAPVVISQPLGAYCIYDPAVNLQSITPATGGVWSGTGVTGNYFTPATAGVGTYTITYTTNPSPLVYCGGVGTTTVMVNAKPEANAYPDVTKGCNPVLVNYATSTVPTGLGVWNFGDGTAQDTGLQVRHTYKVPGTYTATLYYTDDNGCKDTTIATSDVAVYALPVASFNPSLTETTVVDGQVDFTNNSTVLTDNTYTWNIGDGLYMSANTNESYVFTHSGIYVVSLFATSSNNCVDDTSIVIRVNPDVVLYVPNAFTPGSDGLNDVFYIGLPPSGVDYSTFQLSIYDRWGELVYQTNDVTMYWNGAKHNSGPVLKQEVYVWKISFEDEKKQYYERRGHVSLLHK